MKKLGLYISILVLLTSVTSCTRTEKNYYPDGHVQSIIKYRMGKECGKSLYYFDVPNTLEMEVEMKHGKRNGEFKRYFKNGYMDTQCTYVNDSIEGIETMFAPNGIKTQEFTYKHGKKNGPHKAYHLMGEIKIEGNFKDDLFDGDWLYYDERGVVVGEGKLKSGAGYVTFYDQNGHKSRVTNYLNNKKDGKETYYTSSGLVYKEIVFKQDKIVSQTVDSTLIP